MLRVVFHYVTLHRIKQATVLFMFLMPQILVDCVIIGLISEPGEQIQAFFLVVNQQATLL